ncbi:MAG: tyrosine-type recombinase/integrase [Chloroflexi bacterium]|nr:tyrosine-type recombinase/integrase [Chloroflexota bacterium]MBE3133573.1 tyrosine-type recombinase/integrase [Acidobacteriota bacterium]
MSEHHLLGSYIRRFLVEHVVADRNLSRNTQRNYRDAIRVLLRFMTDRHRIDPADLTVEHVTVEVVREFLHYLEQERRNTAATLNQRVTVIHSLFRFIGRHVPELVERASQLQAVPLRRVDHPTVPYLEKAEIDAVLATPDRRRRLGQRDYALLLFLYNTGARADEAAHLPRGALDLGRPASVRILGKGRKTRLCPLWDHTAQVLRELLSDRRDGSADTPVFLNVRGHSLTRFGVHAVVERAVARAATRMPSLNTKRVSPHSVRHTTAVHLLRAGVDINTIRAWLGHVSLETTNRYAEVDLEMKAKALAACAIIGNNHRGDPSAGRKAPDLMTFLASL